MAQVIGTVILVVLALVVISAVLNLVLGLLGFVISSLPLLIKLAFIGGIVYFGWLVVRKLSHTPES